MASAREALRRAETALARERRAGRRGPDAEALVRQADEALTLVQKARGAHNPTGAESILEASGGQSRRSRRPGPAEIGRIWPPFWKNSPNGLLPRGNRSATLGANLWPSWRVPQVTATDALDRPTGAMP